MIKQQVLVLLLYGLCAENQCIIEELNVVTEIPRIHQVESRMGEGETKTAAKPVLKLRVQDIAESSGSAVISVWNPGGLLEILREGKVLGVVGAQVGFLINYSYYIYLIFGFRLSDYFYR